MAKIRQIVEVEIDDIAQMIWNMDAEEQLDLLFALMERDTPVNICMQMLNIRNELDCCALDEKDKKAVRKFVTAFYGYMCGED